MNRLHLLLIVLLLGLSTLSAAAAPEAYRVKDVPNVQLTDRTRFVSDPADAIRPADEEALNRRIAALRDSFGVQIAIVVIPAYDGSAYNSVRAFANELFNTWGIGNRETNRGLLILLITNEDNREITFEVGYGLEGQLTDGLCELIQKRRMIPLMEDGRYAKGLLAGMEEVRKVLIGESTLEADAKAQDEKETKDFVIMVCSIWWLFGGLICAYLLHSQRKEAQKATAFTQNKRSVGDLDFFMGTVGLLVCQFPVVLFYFLFRLFFRKWLRPQVKCEQCGAVDRFTQEKGYPTKEKRPWGKLWTYHYVCTEYGHVKEEKIFKYYWWEGPASRRSSSDNDSGSSWSSGGGSSSGGSWGGGSSGGGGASSSF
ncbi:hypothetical protein N425_02300 [Tannerella sp. oral taxon BU063 isolate Cell 2]|uniref:TPM domain-containing protein n=1 Tax=Tannerella sp. oral taxon BU063 isolate Cell 2 TaxID=1411148 RepID=W2C8M1_9BACT|nr:hypothetical protein N425_02300 [Tannerella sp. oral taxon BU063 isolate Cell 2]